MKCFTVDLLDEISVTKGLASELLKTKTSAYPIVRYAKPSLIYISEPVINSIDPETGLIDMVNIIKTQKERLLLIPETESEDALFVIINNPVSDIFTGEQIVEDCPYQDHLMSFSDCPLCGAPCIDRRSVPQIIERMGITNINDYESVDKYPRYVHYKKGQIGKYPAYKEGVEENGVTLFDIREEKYYFKASCSYSRTGVFSAIVKMKPNSSISIMESKYSKSMNSIVWDGDIFNIIRHNYRY